MHGRPRQFSVLLDATVGALCEASGARGPFKSGATYLVERARSLASYGITSGATLEDMMGGLRGGGCCPSKPQDGQESGLLQSVPPPVDIDEVEMHVSRVVPSSAASSSMPERMRGQTDRRLAEAEKRVAESEARAENDRLHDECDRLHKENETLKAENSRLKLRMEADAIFDTIDADHDGFLSLDELRRHLVTRGGTDSEIRALFSKLDADKDDRITKEELRVGMEGAKTSNDNSRDILLRALEPAEISTPVYPTLEDKDVRECINRIPDKDRRRILHEAVRATQDDRSSGVKHSVDGYAGAEYLFFPTAATSMPRLHPQWWGVSKEQLIEFKAEVRRAIQRGDIKPNPDPNDKRYYSMNKFNSESVGPNMHQVTLGLIKPMTRQADSLLPGLSYALIKNLKTGGLPCELFISHAWDEGVFEFINNALKYWPDGVEAAYSTHRPAMLMCLRAKRVLSSRSLSPAAEHPLCAFEADRPRSRSCRCAYSLLPLQSTEPEHHQAARRRHPRCLALPPRPLRYPAPAPHDHACQLE